LARLTCTAFNSEGGSSIGITVDRGWLGYLEHAAALVVAEANYGSLVLCDQTARRFDQIFCHPSAEKQIINDALARGIRE
jgi:hypothetical protein